MKTPLHLLALPLFVGLSWPLACAGTHGTPPAEANWSVPAVKLAGPFSVVKVTDGDTLTIQIENRQEDIRLVGIDTPEKFAGRKLDADARKSGQTKEQLQALGRQASKTTANLVAGKPVWLELDLQERDRYGRLLGYLYIADPRGDWRFAGKNFRQLNLEIVRAGWADILTIPPNVKYQDRFREAAKQAKGARLGIWGSAPPALPVTDACEPIGRDCPAACPVKGNINRQGKKLFHLPGGVFYARTIPEACFASGDAAREAGFAGAATN